MSPPGHTAAAAAPADQANQANQADQADQADQAASALPADAIGLPALEARLRQDLSWLCLPAKAWVPAQVVDGLPVMPVAIVGGGMAGVALSAALQHMGVPAPMFDQAPAGFEGPWATTARMQTLRSPKELTGPALGLPALTFRAWYEAQFGLAAWAALDKIPRLQWADYLRWYRQVLGLDLRNRQRVVAVRPRADGLVQLDLLDQQGLPIDPAAADASRLAAVDGGRAPAAGGGRPYTVLARHLVLATGRDGLGGPWVPDWAAALPRARWVHSGEHWHGARFAGQRVAVIGGGASAMDVAATALEAGAARVDLLVRRADLPRINKGKGAGNPGMAHGFWSLPDEWKWRFRHYINVQQVPPPHGSTLRVSRHAQAHFHLGAPVLAALQRADGALQLSTPKGPLVVDQLIFSTGFRSRWAQRPELAALAPHVRLWQDRFTAPPGEEDPELDGSPDLGPLFEFQPRVPGACPGLERVHCFSYAATLSQGAGTGDIPQISDGAQRLARGLAAQLLHDDAAHHFEAMQRYADPELDGSEWTAAEWPALDEAPPPIAEGRAA